MSQPSTFAAAIAAAPVRAAADPAAAIVAAAQFLLPHLESGRRIDTPMLRTAMDSAFGASDADGAWTWKTAYDACEAATILFLRKFGPAMRARAASPAAMLSMHAKVTALLPTQTNRSEESQTLQHSRRQLGSDSLRVRQPASRPPISCWSPLPGPGSSQFMPSSRARASS